MEKIAIKLLQYIIAAFQRFSVMQKRAVSNIAYVLVKIHDLLEVVYSCGWQQKLPHKFTSTLN